MKKQNFLHIVLGLMRHSWYGSRHAKRAVPKDAAQRLQEKIHASELMHSGQIRLCVEAALPLGYVWQGLPIRQRAVDLFGRLRVWDTAHNNGVLIYLQLAERKIEIVADRGLHVQTSEATWQPIIKHMQTAFQAQRFEEGLSLAIDQVSALLVQHFPSQAADANELPDAPVIQ